MSTILAISRRELNAYFSTPLAYVFIVIFLALAGATTFYFGGFFQRGQADLAAFFSFHPWLYLFLIPAVGMRLWAEERKSGTVELLMTLPVSTTEAVLGKFVAAWFFTGIALLLTFPIWITVNYLGSPDNGVIFAGYVGSFLMAGAFLAIGSFVSALNPQSSYCLRYFGCGMFSFHDERIGTMCSRHSEDGASAFVVDLVASLSFLTHFDAITKGVFDLRDFIYLSSVIGVFLFANVVVVDLKKGS